MRTELIAVSGDHFWVGDRQFVCNGLPAPRGGGEWLDALLGLIDDASCMDHLPEGHVIEGDEHDLVIRRSEAMQALRQDWFGIIRSLAAIAMEAGTAETSARPEGRQRGHRPNPRGGQHD